MLKERDLALNEFKAYLLLFVQEKRYHLTDDIISDLIRAEYEGERFNRLKNVTFFIRFTSSWNETNYKFNIIAFIAF